MIDHKKCTGCRMCEQICSFSHDKEFNPRAARIRILSKERDGIYAPLLCNQCKVCISACEWDALSWDEAAGVVRVDDRQCVGCGACVDSCPEGATFLDPTANVVRICDLCNGDPQCVKWCYPQALSCRTA